MDRLYTHSIRNLFCAAVVAGSGFALAEPAELPVLGKEVLRWLPSKGLVGARTFDGKLRAPGKQSVAGKIGLGFRVGDGAAHVLKDRAGKAVGDWDRDQAFSISLWAKTDADANGNQTLVSRFGEVNKSRGWSVEAYSSSGHLGLMLGHQWPAGILKVLTPPGSFRRGEWHPVVMTYDGSSKPEGIAIYVGGTSQKLQVELDGLNGTIRNTGDTLIGSRSGDRTPARQAVIDEVRMYNRVLEDVEIQRLARLVPGRREGRAATVRVSLAGPAVLSLAEVEVFVAGHNVAPTGQASQSHSDPLGEAHRANDGKINGSFKNGSVTRSLQKGSDPWWKMDLAFPAAVERVVVWNRWDGEVLAQRLSGAKVEVFDVGGTLLWEGTVPAPAPKSIVFDVGLVDLEGLKPESNDFIR